MVGGVIWAEVTLYQVGRQKQLDAAEAGSGIDVSDYFDVGAW